MKKAANFFVACPDKECFEGRAPVESNYCPTCIEHYGWFIECPECHEIIAEGLANPYVFLADGPEADNLTCPNENCKYQMSFAFPCWHLLPEEIVERMTSVAEEGNKTSSNEKEEETIKKEKETRLFFD